MKQLQILLSRLHIGIRTDKFESKKRSVGGVGQCYNVTIPGSVELKGEPRHMLVKNAQSASAMEKDPWWASVVARNTETDGTLSGYRRGVQRKRALLEREAHS
jgi:hypothetical protein